MWWYLCAGTEQVMPFSGAQDAGGGGGRKQALARRSAAAAILLMPYG